MNLQGRIQCNVLEKKNELFFFILFAYLKNNNQADEKRIVREIKFSIYVCCSYN
jgi:hypothetical protein